MKNYSPENLYCLQNMLLFNSYIRCYPFEYASAFNLEQQPEQTGFVIDLIGLLLRLKLIEPGHIDVHKHSEKDYARQTKRLVDQLREQEVSFEFAEQSLYWWNWDLYTTPLCNGLLKKHAIAALKKGEISQPFINELIQIHSIHHHHE